MTREESINKWIIPTIKNTWNEKKCKEILEALEQEPETGHWNTWIDKDGFKGWECSICAFGIKTEMDYLDFNYCPRCGAKMESEE